MLIDGATWNWAKNLKKDATRLTPEKYAEELVGRLRADFDLTFLVVKTQKLISTSRDLARTKLVADIVAGSIRSLPISGKKRSVLQRHCETTIFFQEILSR